MRLLPAILGTVAFLVLLEVGINVLLRPQEGPPALGAILEAHLLAVGAVAALLAILMTLGERGPGASRLRLVAAALIVVATVRLGGEWWSPAVDDTDAVSPAAEAPMPLAVLSWNLERGSKAPATTLAGLFGAEPRPDLVAIQELTAEVAAAIEAEASVTAEYPYRILEPGVGAEGMGLLSRHPLVLGTSSTAPMLLTAGLLMPDGSRIEVLNAHAYPPHISAVARIPLGVDTRRRDEDLAVLRAAVDAAPDPTRVILVGDLNVSPFEPGFARIAEGLRDAHAEVATGTGFTWRPSVLEPLNLGLLRIDHVFTGAALRPVAVEEDCSLPGDHCRLSVTLEVAPGD